MKHKFASIIFVSYNLFDKVWDTIKKELLAAYDEEKKEFDFSKIKQNFYFEFSFDDFPEQYKKFELERDFNVILDTTTDGAAAAEFKKAHEDLADTITIYLKVIWKDNVNFFLADVKSNLFHEMMHLTQHNMTLFWKNYYSKNPLPKDFELKADYYDVNKEVDVEKYYHSRSEYDPIILSIFSGFIQYMPEDISREDYFQTAGEFIKRQPFFTNLISYELVKNIQETINKILGAEFLLVKGKWDEITQKTYNKIANYYPQLNLNTIEITDPIETPNRNVLMNIYNQFSTLTKEKDKSVGAQDLKLFNRAVKKFFKLLSNEKLIEQFKYEPFKVTKEQTQKELEWKKSREKHLDQHKEEFYSLLNKKLDAATYEAFLFFPYWIDKTEVKKPRGEMKYFDFNLLYFPDGSVYCTSPKIQKGRFFESLKQAKRYLNKKYYD